MDEKILTPVDVVLGWRIEHGPDPDKITLILRHQRLADLQANAPDSEKWTVLVLLREQATELSDDLSRMSAAAPRPARFDS